MQVHHGETGCGKKTCSAKHSIKYLLVFIVVMQITTTNVLSQINNPTLGGKYQNDSVTATGESNYYKWIGTTKGLWCIAKKNGKRYVYRQSNSKIPSNYVTSICCRKDGDVWIGTTKGMLRFDGYTDILVDKNNSELPNEFVTAIIEDVHEVLWIATKGGILKITRNHQQSYQAGNSNLPDNNVKSLSVNDDGEVTIHYQELQSFNVSKLKYSN